MSEIYTLNTANQVKYNARVNDTMLKIARFVPGIMFVYGLLVYFHVVVGSPLYSWQAFVVLIVMLVITGVTQSDDPGQSPLQQVNFYLIFLGFSIFVAGTSSILLYWAPLSITTTLNFGAKGYWLSTILLFGFSLIDGFIQYPLKGFDYLLSNLAIAGLAAVSAGVVVIIITALQTDHSSLIRVKQRESLQYNRMQAIINGLSDAVVSTDSRGVVRLYNASALSLVDTNKSLTGQKIDDILNLRDGRSKKIHLFDLMRDKSKAIVREDLSHYFDDNESIRLAITAAPIYTSFRAAHRSQQGFIFIIRDITKSKSLEEERDEFISVISHELRTPITITEASISNMQLLAQREDPNSTIVKGLGEAHDQVLYLAKITNDLAALSRAEQGSVPEQDEINVNKLMESLYSEYALQARAHNLMLNIDVPTRLGVVTTNRLYLEEILQNLITNALKYTLKGSITIHAARVEGGVLFAVKDTGIGIAKTEKDKIFQKFYRSEDYRTRETSGTGLGLYVAQKLAVKLSTKLELTSRLHHGSTFSFVVKN